MSETVLQRVVAAVTAAGATYNPNVQIPPAAVLWPDETAQWAPVIHRIDEYLPVVTLGAYEPERRRGPAYWIRCVVARTIDVGLPDGPVVVYLPGVPRAAVRAAESCPPKLAPIVELQYRSQWHTNPKGRDWTVRALLSDRERGLGLDVADDAASTAALLGALDRLLDEPVDRLAHQRIDAEFCNQLVNPDLVRILLGWLDDPAGYRSTLAPAQWTAFVHQSKTKFRLDPDRHGEIAAAGKLGDRHGPWEYAWNRFAETPDLYPGIPDQLRKARPETLTTDHDDSWPQDNENAEDQLCSMLRDCAALTADGARKQVAALDTEHAHRRATVWAVLGHAPLAFAVEQLAVLAEVTARHLASTDLPALVADHVLWGWKADDAFLRALAATRTSPDRVAVVTAAEAMYRPWVDAAATAMQALVGPMVSSGVYSAAPAVAPAQCVVTVFVDGLRLDVAHRVRERLTAAAFDVQVATALAALPTVTETAKAALVPVSAGALAAGADLHARNTSTGTKATIDVLRTLMRAHGVQVLDPTDIGDPSGSAWAEVGDIDGRGHQFGTELVDQLDEQVDRIVDRVRDLLAAGWGRVDLCTDHGWLLMPDGLAKVELAASTTTVKKGRCARLKDGAAVSVPTVAWHWDGDVRIAVAPGASCFEAGKEYEHGGISPQECIVPRLSVAVGDSERGGPEVPSVKWLGLRCRFEVSGAGAGIRADLRRLAADASTSIAETAKDTSPRGLVSLVVPDEDLAGERAHLVLVDPDGRVLVDREVVVGGNRT